MARSKIADSSLTFSFVIVVLIWNSSPVFFAALIPFMTPSKAPATRRNASWLWAVAPSMLRLIRWILPSSI